MNRTSKVILTILGGIGILVAIFVGGSIVYIYLTNRTFNQTLATNLDVSNEWIDIRPDPPLQTRRIVAEIAMAIPNHRAERGASPFAVKLPDGRIVQPQIQIIDERGNVFELKHTGFNYTGSEDLIIFRSRGDLPDTTYTHVRIRSDIPFTCERIFWRERNPK